MTSRGSIAFVLVTVTLDMLAIGLVIPVMPKLVESFLGGDTSRAAVMFGYMSLTFALAQLVFSPLLGALSDTYGRRPVLLFSNVGLGLDYLLMALAPALSWLFVARALSGIAAATFSTAAAYVSDVTPLEKRAAAFGLIGAAGGIGFVIGPALGGVLGSIDPQLPFWTAAGFSLANAIYGYFVLPESLAPENRRPFQFKSANPVGAVKFLFGDAKFAGLSSVLLCFHVAHAVLPSVFVLFAGYRFGWGPREVGLVLALVGVCSIVVQAGLTRVVVARFGAETTLMIGIGAGVVGFFMQGVVTDPWLYVLGIPVFALWGFISPSAMQILSGRAGPEAQGQLQGANAGLMSMANLAGPLIFSQIFAVAIASGPGATWAGAPFLLASALLVVAGVIALRVAPPRIAQTRGRPT